MVQLSNPPYVVNMIVPLEDAAVFEPGREILINMRLRSDAPPADLSGPISQADPISDPILQKNAPVVLDVGGTLQI